MHSYFSPRRCFLSILAVFLAVPPLALGQRVQDFSFLQISDMHLSPQPHGMKVSSDGSAGTIAWLCEEAVKPQAMQPYGITAPAPAFVIATGDVTEFGVIAGTFGNLERYFQPLKIPLYITPGNHDNTWTGILSVMRERHGGDHYSFDKFGCHFASFSSASPQEPLPCIEQRTLTWLEQDLKKVQPGTPIFLFAHHPLSTTEFAEPYEQLRLLEVLRGHNVVLYMMGHGHGASAQKWGTLDSVMGGSTLNNDIGYSIISVQNGVLRVGFRFKDPEKPMKQLLEKRLAPPSAPEVVLVSPAGSPKVSGRAVPVHVRIQNGRAEKVVATIDGDKEKLVELSAVSRSEFRGVVSTDGLLPGAHYLHVTATCGKLKLDRAVSFLLTPSGQPARETRWTLSAGMKAGPVIAGDTAIVATTAGEVLAISPKSGERPRSLLNTGAEILWAPALVDRMLYIACGDGNVYAVDVAGRLVWKRPVGASVYGTPAVDSACVYVGDLEGIVHAIERSSGKLKWSKRHAQFSIEAPMLLHQGVIYFGAWDGYVYAVDAVTGGLRWKKPGPHAQASGKAPNRYYAPADCPVFIAGDTLYVSDRAYFLGAYALDGSYKGQIGKSMPAIAASADGRNLYVRGNDGGLACHDAEGKQVWAAPDTLGRFPIPPTEAGDKLYVCTNEGTLLVYEKASGRELLRYQVTPKLHVMSPVGVDASGAAWVTGMDGTVTRVMQ